MKKRAFFYLIAIDYAYFDAAQTVAKNIGVSTYYPQHSKVRDIEWLDATDQGLYRARDKGRNHVELQPLSSEA